jgi:hypothetical protein
MLPPISSHHFMENEVSFSHSQELSTCSYPDPDHAIPQHLILSLQAPS